MIFETPASAGAGAGAYGGDILVIIIFDLDSPKHPEEGGHGYTKNAE